MSISANEAGLFDLGQTLNTGMVKALTP